jgi:hypothetical protein
MKSKATVFLSSALLCAAFAATAADEPTSSKTAIAAIAESTSAILQGDSARALAALEATPATEFLGKDADYRACMLERYHARKPVLTTSSIEDPFLRGVLDDYQDYWWRSLAAPAQRDKQEAALLAKLHKRLGASAVKATNMDEIEPVLQTQLEQHGYHAQLGRTPPLRELMVWRKQDTRMYDVQLPEGPYSVRVELLDDFVSRGWMAYGRCERGSAGGWATDKALYAVVGRYTQGLDSEEFRVVFLGHETQHFADQNAFPGMASWELEYRAKLVELAQGREVSAKRLDYMLTAQSDDISSPHTYANKRVVADLTRRLGKSPDAVSIDELQVAARDQLLADTRERKAKAPGTADAK